MTSPTHVALGLLSGLIILHNYPSVDVYTTISAACIGSLIPDLDTKKSDPSQIFPIVSKIVDKVTKHRGATHNMLPFIFIILYYYANYYPFLIMGLGGLSHTVIDALTLKVKIRCGSVGESVLYYLFWVFNFLFIVNLIVTHYKL